MNDQLVTTNNERYFGDPQLEWTMQSVCHEQHFLHWKSLGKSNQLIKNLSGILTLMFKNKKWTNLEAFPCLVFSSHYQDFLNEEEEEYMIPTASEEQEKSG